MDNKNNMNDVSLKDNEIKDINVNNKDEKIKENSKSQRSEGSLFFKNKKKLKIVESDLHISNILEDLDIDDIKCGVACCKPAWAQVKYILFKMFYYNF